MSTKSSINSGVAKTIKAEETMDLPASLDRPSCGIKTELYDNSLHHEIAVDTKMPKALITTKAKNLKHTILPKTSNYTKDEAVETKKDSKDVPMKDPMKVIKKEPRVRKEAAHKVKKVKKVKKEPKVRKTRRTSEEVKIENQWKADHAENTYQMMYAQGELEDVDEDGKKKKKGKCPKLNPTSMSPEDKELFQEHLYRVAMGH